MEEHRFLHLGEFTIQRDGMGSVLPGNCLPAFATTTGTETGTGTGGNGKTGADKQTPSCILNFTPVPGSVDHVTILIFGRGSECLQSYWNNPDQAQFPVVAGVVQIWEGKLNYRLLGTSMGTVNPTEGRALATAA